MSATLFSLQVPERPRSLNLPSFIPVKLLNELHATFFSLCQFLVPPTLVADSVAHRQLS